VVNVRHSALSNQEFICSAAKKTSGKEQEVSWCLQILLNADSDAAESNPKI
jgi:hypothetical protein